MEWVNIERLNPHRNSLQTARFPTSQEPKDCKNRRKLIVKSFPYCGFGCFTHHLAKCFMIAMGTNRTMVIDDATLVPYMRGQFKECGLFRSVSESCEGFDTSTTEGSEWMGEFKCPLSTFFKTLMKLNLFNRSIVFVLFSKDIVEVNKRGVNCGNEK